MAGGRQSSLRFGVYVLLGGLFCVYRAYYFSKNVEETKPEIRLDADELIHSKGKYKRND